jgi:hypothetical protein
MPNRKNVKSQRPLCQRKKGKPKVKTLRGKPEIYGQKKRQFNATLTPKTIETLENIAVLIGESRSQVIEKAIRGEIDLSKLLEQLRLLPREI